MQAGDPIGVTAENVEVAAEEESSLPQITDPLVQRKCGDVLEDTGNLGVVGDLEIHTDNNELFEKSAQKGEDGQDTEVVQILELVLTEEEKVEICLEQVGMQSGVQCTQEGIAHMDKDGFGQRIPTELHDASCGDDNTDVILIMGQTITNLSHPCAIPLNDKGKKVMGSCSEYDVGPKLDGKWKRRARNIDHQGLPLQSPRTDLASRKRNLEDSLHGHLESDNNLKKKSKTGSGVVPNNDPLSVAAVG